MIFKASYLLAIVCFISVVSCDELKHNSTKSEVAPTPPVSNAAQKKSREIRSYVGMISCAMKYDPTCFLNVAGDFLEDKKNELLEQADAEALRATGRSDEESRPSELANTLGKVISELSSLFQNGFSGLFQEAKEVGDGADLDDDDEEETEAKEDEKNGTARSNNGEARGKKKKKKKKLESLLKLFVFAALVYKKISLLLKIFHAVLQFKFFLIALGGLLLHAAKFWHSLKKEHSPSKVIYYEHAQHQHHYGHGEEDWGRAFGDRVGVTEAAVDPAYFSHRPHGYHVEYSPSDFI